MSIGQRAAWGEKRGTIKYIGEVPPHRGLYYGIEWDNPKDGKHNGTYNGVKYFETAHPMSGSFVKASEVNLGTKFVDILRKMYETDYSEIGWREALEDIAQQLNISRMDIIGLEKMKQLQGPLNKLRSATLAGCLVCDPGEYGEIEEVCPSIETLDLSDNFLPSWDALAVIGKQLKKLTVLSVSHSRIKMPDEPEKYKDCFLRLKELMIVSCSYTWEDVLGAAVMWPNLEMLRAAGNRISELAEPENVLQNLTLLDLAYNQIDSWSEVCKLSCLKKLRCLNLRGNKISSIRVPKDCSIFPNLDSLYLTENNVENWSDIVDLNNLPSLKVLMFKRNPVMKSQPPTVYRGKIIARIGNLHVLNGREIEADERRGAEYEYLREFADDWFKCKMDDSLRQKFTAEHPRYDELVKTHGPPVLTTWCGPHALQPDLITVNLQLLSKDGEVLKSASKKLHCSMAVYKLIAIVRRLFNMSDIRPKLMYVDKENPGITHEMEDLKSIDHYGMCDGDYILVTELEP